MTTEKNNKTANARVRMTEEEMRVVKKNAEDVMRQGHVSVSEYIRIMAVYAAPVMTDVADLENVARKLHVGIEDKDPQEFYDFMQATEKYVGVYGFGLVAKVGEYDLDSVEGRIALFAAGRASYVATFDLFGMAKAYAEAQNESK